MAKIVRKVFMSHTKEVNTAEGKVKDHKVVTLTDVITMATLRECNPNLTLGDFLKQVDELEG